jgi:hypothetical protein
MRNALTFVLPVLSLCLYSSASPAPNRDAGVIDRFLSRQIAGTGGEEYREARKTAAGDLNRDGRADVAVLYTIEGMGGSNNYVQHLAVFARIKGRLVPVAHTAVGGKGDRLIELQAIKKGVILCKTLDAATASDPSRHTDRKPTTIRFVLVGRTLQEQQRPAPPR